MVTETHVQQFRGRPMTEIGVPDPRRRVGWSLISVVLLGTASCTLDSKPPTDPYEIIRGLAGLRSLADYTQVGRFLGIPIAPNATSKDRASYVQVNGRLRLNFADYISNGSVPNAPGVWVDYRVIYPGGPASRGSTEPLGSVSITFGEKVKCVSVASMDRAFGPHFVAGQVMDSPGQVFGWRIPRRDGKPLVASGPFGAMSDRPFGCTFCVTVS